MKPQRRTNSTPTSPTAATSHAHGTSKAREPEANTPISIGHERIPPQWAWHFRTLTHLREQLMRAHTEHATQAIAPADRLGGDVADAAQDQTDRDMLWAELGNETDQLFEVDCALQRIRDGVYGFCEETGHPIPVERLRAIPWTRYALAVAQSIEERSTDIKKHPR